MTLRSMHERENVVVTDNLEAFGPTLQDEATPEHPQRLTAGNGHRPIVPQRSAIELQAHKRDVARTRATESSRVTRAAGSPTGHVPARALSLASCPLIFCVVPSASSLAGPTRSRACSALGSGSGRVDLSDLQQPPSERIPPAVMTRSPRRRCSFSGGFSGGTTTYRTPAAVQARTNPNAVRTASQDSALSEQPECPSLAG
jgi:hypothetical protein